MEEIQLTQYPEAVERIQWPPENWPDKFWNTFDAFRWQASDVQEDLIRQGIADGIVHYCAKSPGEGWDDSWWLCHYHEEGCFFSEWHVSVNGETMGWRYFQSEAAARRYGMKFIPGSIPKLIP